MICIKEAAIRETQQEHHQETLIRSQRRMAALSTHQGQKSLALCYNSQVRPFYLFHLSPLRAMIWGTKGQPSEVREDEEMNKARKQDKWTTIPPAPAASCLKQTGLRERSLNIV